MKQQRNRKLQEILNAQQTRKDVRGNEKTEMIYFCAKQYRLTYQLMSVVNHDVLAVWEFISQCAWWPSRNSSSQINEELNGSWNKPAWGAGSPGLCSWGLAALQGGTEVRGSCGNQLSCVLKEEPASLHHTWSCFHSSLPLWICSLCFLRSSNVAHKTTLLLGQLNHVQRRKATSQQDTQPQLGGSMLAGKKHTWCIYFFNDGDFQT